MNRRSFLKSLGGLSLVPVVGSTASIQAHDNKVMYNGQFHGPEFRYAILDEIDIEPIDWDAELEKCIPHRDLNFVTEHQNKHVDALERRV